MGNCLHAPAQVEHDKSKAIPASNAPPLSSSPGTSSSFTYTTNTCALEYWEPIKLLSEGSISTIHLVRRRSERVEIPYIERAEIMQRAKKASEDYFVLDDRDKTNNKQPIYALKSIMKDFILNDRYLQEMRDEINTMSKLSHPNIVNVVEAYERKRHVYLIMELCRGGDLTEVEGTTEKHAKAIIRRVLSAVAYMHDKGVVHRDLKLENIMFNTAQHKASEIKIIDFGLATKYLSDEHKKMTDKVGTLYTIAPQVMQGVYDKKCDLWSIGVITYILLSGTKPFWGPDFDMVWAERKKIMIDLILRADYAPLEKGKWDSVSPEATKFVKSLLRLDPKRRPSAKKALEATWMMRVDDTEIEEICENTKEQKRLRMQRLALLVLMEKISSAEILNLQQVLQKYDPEETGWIEYAHLREALEETGRFDREELDQALPPMEENDKSRHIDRVDFITKALEKRGRVETERIMASFEELDTGKNGKISLQKLGEKLDGLIPLEWKNEFLNLGNLDGTVDRLDVMRWFGRKSFFRLPQLRETDEKLEPKTPEDLLTPSNASIPGGRADPNSKQRFFYDESSQTMRRIEE